MYHNNSFQILLKISKNVELSFLMLNLNIFVQILLIVTYLIFLIPNNL